MTVVECVTTEGNVCTRTYVDTKHLQKQTDILLRNFASQQHWTNLREANIFSHCLIEKNLRAMPDPIAK